MTIPGPGSTSHGSSIPGGVLAADAPAEPNPQLDKLKELLFKNFEGVLVIIVLGSLLFITAFVVNKFAFLLFYFIPVLMAGFYLGARHSIATAVLTSAFVTYVALVDPFGTQAEGDTTFDFWNLMIWASFLTLTGAIVGQLQEKNNDHMKKLRDAYIGIIQILTKYLEAADEYTKNHSERVAELSVIIAHKLDLDPGAVSNLRSAALLHDIGKIEVIDLINKAGPLDDDEKKKVDKHTQLGAEIILTTGTVLSDVIPLVLDHHRLYSEGGEDIPLGARIIAVADTYDAVRTDRPYRAGRLHGPAIEILAGGAGEAWDPAIVDALSTSEREILTVYEV